MNNSTGIPKDLRLAKAKLDSAFFKKGITLAITSGICYGLYTAFLGVAVSKGVWADWYSESTILNSFFVIFVLGALGSAINDTCSGIWAWVMMLIKGKAGDFANVIKTKPGMMMVACALVGGPFAGTCYIIAFTMGGASIAPVTALCPAIGAILGRVLYKQELNLRMSIGVAICVCAAILTGWSGLSGATVNPFAFFIAFLAALGWGIEGCVAGYGTTLIDYEIGIGIRQTTSGLSNLIILVPVLALIGGDMGLGLNLIGTAIMNPASIIFFLVSGFFSLFAFSLWYKGNSMCGAPLGMACNGAYSFWVPFFSMIILGQAMDIFVWISAIIMIVGIFLIAMNPLDLFNKKEVA